MAGKLGGELHRAVVGGGGHGQRPLAIDRTLGTGAVAAMGIDDPVLGDLPQPEVIGHHRIGQIVLQPAVGLDQHFLHDVADVDPLLNPLVEAKLHHPPQRIAVAVHRRLTAAVSPPLASASKSCVFSASGHMSVL